MYCARRLAISAICCTFLLCCITAYADTHWANHAGSNTPPYTSYATGAHQIQDVINEAMAGDTIRIAAGLYHPDTTIFLKDSLTILGAGRDSTVIHPLYSASSEHISAVMYMHGSSGEAGGELTIRGCKFIDVLSGPLYYARRYGIMIFFQTAGQTFVVDNSFENLRRSVFIHEAEATIAENFIVCKGDGIALGSFGPYEVAGNIITGVGELDRGIAEAVYIIGPVTIHNNTINIPSGHPIALVMAEDSVFIYNNLLVSEAYNALLLYCHYGGAVIRNNTIVRRGVNQLSYHNKNSALFAVGGPSGMVIENNAFWCLNVGVDFQKSDIVPGGGEFTVAHNSFWRADSGSVNLMDFDDDLIIDTSSNIYRKPMFADDSLFCLQRGSPLIDAGNPAYLDLDMTCSDIGWTGGAGGILYDYPELPPNAPDTLISTSDGDLLYLMWPMNQEADLSIYRVYKGLESGFPLEEGNMIAELAGEDTTYLYPMVDSSSDVFFKITAMDTVGLESDPSNEIAVLSTGVFEEEEQGNDPIPGTPSLTAYPNPFNSVTTIRFIVPQGGSRDTHVNITVYDILGARVAVLLDDFVLPGTHTISWQGMDGSGRPLASGIYFASMKTSGVEHTASTKLLLLK